MSLIQKIVASNIRYFMNERGMSQGELTVKSAVGPGSISIAVHGSGTQGITLESLALIAEALGVDPGDLVDDWRGELDARHD